MLSSNTVESNILNQLLKCFSATSCQQETENNKPSSFYCPAFPTSSPHEQPLRISTMSRQLISSEKFPPKPHNSPASKVPGLIFCAGQTATGEIKQATVFNPIPPPSSPQMKSYEQKYVISEDQANPCTLEDRATESEGGPRVGWLIRREDRQDQCLPCQHARFCWHERGLY